MGSTLKKPEERYDKNETTITKMKHKKGRVKRVYHTPKQELEIFNKFTVHPSLKLNNKIFVDFSGAEIDLGRLVITPCSNTKYGLMEEYGAQVYQRSEIKAICNSKGKRALLNVPLPTQEQDKYLYELKKYENGLRRSYYIRFDKLGKQLFYLTGSCATIGTTCRIDLLNADTNELGFEGKILLKKIDEMELCRDAVKIGQILLEFLHLLKLTVLRPDFMKYERKSSFENLFRLLRELCEILIRVHYRQVEANIIKNKSSMMSGDV